MFSATGLVGHALNCLGDAEVRRYLAWKSAASVSLSQEAIPRTFLHALHTLASDFTVLEKAAA